MRYEIKLYDNIGSPEKGRINASGEEIYNAIIEPYIDQYYKNQSPPQYKD